MPQRLYLGRLAADATQADVQKLFENYGRLLECRVMTGFGFVEFENSKDAEDVVTEFNGKQFMGQPIIVEYARENRRRGGDFEGGGRPPRRDDRERRGPPMGRRPPGFRIIVTGISRDTSWQDLKDFGREAGNVSFADVDRDFPGHGILEYVTQDDADYAVKKLDGRELRGIRVRVDPDRGGSWRESSGRARDGERDERYRDDRYREDRRRSRSPRRDEYRRRSRSPRSAAPRRDEREERPAEERREEYRRPREEKDPREYDRRPAADEREASRY